MSCPTLDCFIDPELPHKEQWEKQRALLLTSISDDPLRHIFVFPAPGSGPRINSSWDQLRYGSWLSPVWRDF